MQKKLFFKKYTIKKFRAKILEYSKFTYYKNNVFSSPDKSRKICENQGTESGFKIMSEINAVNVSYMRIWRKWVPFHEIKKKKYSVNFSSLKTQ